MTTEILPAIPDPETTPVPDLLDHCRRAVAWANECDDIAAVREKYDQLQDIARYLGRQDHARTSQAALRMLEVRIGVLAGPPEPGRRTDLKPIDRDRQVPEVPKDDLHLFRKLAEHADVVAEVIAESTEQEPASRAKVLRAVKAKLGHQARDDFEAEAEAGMNKLREAAKAYAGDNRYGDRSHLDQRRIHEGYNAAIGICHGIEALIETATPEDVAYAMEHHMLQHVSDNLTAKLNLLLPKVQDYWEAIQS